MREILFRGKTEQGEWVYGDLIQGSNTYIMVSDFHEVIPSTIGQYTGRNDAQMIPNNKKIFEGDIVQIFKRGNDWWQDKELGKYIVRYDEENTEYILDPTDKDDELMSLCHVGEMDIEVIGNIHESEVAK